MNRTKFNFEFSFEFNDNSCAKWYIVTQRNSVYGVDMASCFMSSKNESGCGEFKGESELVPLSECNSDITAHLRRCHLTKENITESELILLRAGYFRKTAKQVENMLVCPRHRANLGKEWGNQTGRTACPYPDYQGKLKGVKSDRAVTVKIAREVMEVFGITIPVGSRELQLLITFCLFVFVSCLPDIHRNTRGISHMII